MSVHVCVCCVCVYVSVKESVSYRTCGWDRGRVHSKNTHTHTHTHGRALPHSQVSVRWRQHAALSSLLWLSSRPAWAPSHTPRLRPVRRFSSPARDRPRRRSSRTVCTHTHTHTRHTPHNTTWWTSIVLRIWTMRCISSVKKFIKDWDREKL